jgi:alkylation response protein AidB-like acyl-CoA dehydrogenase
VVGEPVGYHGVADRQSGPVINRFGTDAQKERFPPFAAELSFDRHERTDSGSDLASVARLRRPRTGGS